MTHKAEAFLDHRSGPFGTVRSCRLCAHYDKIPSGLGQGRGYGMREGGKSRGRMIQHIKAEHPNELARVPDDWFHTHSNWHWRNAT